MTTHRYQVVVLLATSTFILAGCGISHPNAVSSTTSTTTVSTPPLTNQFGTGSGITKPFTIASHWSLVWSVVCGNDERSHLVVEIRRSSTYVPNLRISVAGKSLAGSKSSIKAGTFKISVTTGHKCTWGITAYKILRS